MLEKLKKNSRKVCVIRIVISLIIAACCMVYAGPGLLQIVKGPTKITSLEDLSQLEGQYVTYDVRCILDYYIEMTSTSSKTGVTKTTGLGYVVYNTESGTIFAANIETSDTNKYSDVIDASYDWLYDDSAALPDGFTVTGTFKPLSGTPLTYFNEIISEYVEDSYSDYVFPYYIDDGYVGDHSIFSIYCTAVVAAVALLFAILTLLKLKGTPYLKEINKFLSENPTLSLSAIETDFATAQEITKSTWVGRQYTIYMPSMCANILDNQKLVWAYYYQRRGRHPESKVITFDINKTSRSINLSKANADVLLQNYSMNQPQMMIGYDKDLEKTFKKEFQTFLGYRYNAAKAEQDAQNSGFSSAYNM